MNDAIDQLIEVFVQSPMPDFLAVQAAAAKYRFLPLYFGWTRILGITPGAEIVEWDPEQDRPGIAVVSAPYFRRIVLAQGAAKYPELAALAPSRPELAVTCDQCAGTGKLLDERLICQCGGLGWVIPGEQRSENW